MLTPPLTVLWCAVIFVICVKEKKDRKRRCTNIRFFPHITKIHVEWDKLFLLTLKVGLFKLRTSSIKEQHPRFKKEKLIDLETFLRCRKWFKDKA